MKDKITKMLPKKLIELIYRFTDDEVLALASQLAYSLIISVFPFLVFLINLLAFLPIPNTEVLSILKTILPQSTYLLLHNTITEIINTQNTNLLSLSIVFTIWTASTGFGAVIRGFNRAYDVEEKRSFLKVQTLTVLCTLGLTLVLISSIVLLIFGGIIGRNICFYFGLSNNLNKIFNIVRYMVSVIITIFIFSLAYYYIPSKKLKWIKVIPGAVFSTIAWIIVSLVFSFYVDNFNNYSRLYGSIGVVIAFLVWLYLTSLIILLGGEINAIIALENKRKKL